MCDKSKTGLDLSAYDVTMNSIQQDKMFKGTIAICVIYGAFAAILLAAAYFSSNIKNLLFDRFFPFTMVYIIGTIIIILIFITYIMTFKPKKYTRLNDYEYISCPDYWNLEIQDEENIKNIFDSSYPTKLFKYKCVMDDKIFNRTLLFNSDTASLYKYRLTNDSINLNTSSTTNRDKYKADKADKYIENTKNIHLYKNINETGVDISGSSTSLKKKSIIKNTLTSNALIMNNYEKAYDATNAFIGYSNIFQTKDPLNVATPAYSSNIYPNTVPVTWYIDADTTAITAISDFTSSSVIDWSDISYETLAAKYGEDNLKSPKNKFIVYVKTTSPTYGYFGYIYIDVTNKKISYVSENSILLATSYGLVVADFTNNNTIYANIGMIDNTTVISSVTNFSDKLVADKIAAVINDIITKNNYYKAASVLRLQCIKTAVERPIFIPSANTSSKNIPLVCDTVYPMFLAYNEDNDSNDLRCAYSKACQVPWSDMHCD
jgi:hypothetical protein